MVTATRQLMRAKEVRKACGGWSDMTLWRKINEPNSSFPKPVYRNRVRYWYADEIADYWSKEAGHDAAA